MNKKLLFGIMSLAALTACTNDEFESQNVTQEASPVQFEVINGLDDAFTRASMNGNKIEWNAKDGDIFTLYHGSTTGGFTTGYENATYKANANEGGTATLTTPSVIKEGKAIMVWPVDTTFRIKPADALSLKIPAVLDNIEKNIPYVSDLLDIQAHAAYEETSAYPTAYSTAGKDRKYPIYMRPMASQLTINADYVGTDATLKTLYEGGLEGLTGDDAITPITITSVDLLTQNDGATLFTTEIPLKFTAPSAAIQDRWDDVPHNKYNATTTLWNQVTDFDVANIAATGQVNKLSTSVINGTESCKFLILPQAKMTTDGAGVLDGGIVVNTYYGRVVIADNGKTYNTANYGYKPAATGAVSAYTAAEYAKAWYRYIAATSVAADGETKATAETAGLGYKTTSSIEMGLKQTINTFSDYKQKSGVIQDEPTGAAATRYVEVRLNHLDMSDLHIQSDKQLRDVVRVWKKLNLPDVTVYLDGDASTAKKFEISQKTIKLINDINATTAGKSFKVMPCDATHKQCNLIVINGGGELQDIAFIEANGTQVANVALKAGQTWKWKAFDAAGTTNKTLKAKVTGVGKIINNGTLVSDDANAVLRTAEPTGAQNFIPFENARNANWNLTAGTLRVQFNVTNNGTVTISKGAQYRQDGNAGATTFTNQADDIPTRFNGSDNRIGTVWNYGVFATLGTGGAASINNYGLIEHADVDAKTYVTNNQLGGFFTTAFGGANKMGRINLPWNNKSEDNISVSAALNQGFISLTVDNTFTDETLSLATSTIGNKVNYLKVNSNFVKEIATFNPQIKYLEIKAPNEVAWNVTSGAFSFTGLMVLSDVNIKLGSTVNVTGATYLGADMYVGGNFAWGSWSGYFGNTSGNVATKYITY